MVVAVIFFYLFQPADNNSITIVVPMTKESERENAQISSQQRPCIGNIISEIIDKMVDDYI